MVARKKAATGTSNLPATMDDWEKELAQYAQETETREVSGSGGNFLSARGGVFRFGETELDSPLRVVVINWAYENNYFASEYDPDRLSPPDCYALALRHEELGPNDEQHLAAKQSPVCEGCWASAWGSGQGRGKACGEKRRLQLAPVFSDNDLELIRQGAIETVLYKLPVTSVKTWAGYVNKLAKAINRPEWGVITNLHLESDPRTQFRIRPEVDEVITDPTLLAGIKKLRESGLAQLLTGYEAPREDEPGPSNRARSAKLRGGKAPSEKPAARRR